MNARNNVSQRFSINPRPFFNTGQRFPAMNYALLVLCIGTMQLSTNYVFANMPVGYALSLFQLSTLVSVLFGYRFFKEKDIMKKIIGSVIMIGGSIIIILLK
jgi:drug/metabolite transporter (DMT)-like permease